MTELSWVVSLAVTYLVYRVFRIVDVVDWLLLGLEKCVVKVDKGVSTIKIEKIEGKYIRFKWQSDLSLLAHRDTLSQVLFFTANAVTVFVFHSLMWVLSRYMDEGGKRQSSSLFFVLGICLICYYLVSMIMRGSALAGERLSREIWVCVVAAAIAYLTASLILVVMGERASDVDVKGEIGGIGWLDFGLNKAIQKASWMGSIVKFIPFGVASIAAFYTFILVFPFTRIAKINLDLFVPSSLGAATGASATQTTRHRNGQIPYLYRVGLKMLQSVTLLLLACANPSVRDSLGMTSLDSWAFLCLIFPIALNILATRIYLQVYLNSAADLSKSAGSLVYENLCLVTFQILCPWLLTLFHVLLMLDNSETLFQSTHKVKDDDDDDNLPIMILTGVRDLLGSWHPILYFLTWWNLLLSYVFSKVLENLYKTVKVDSASDNIESKKDQ